LTYIHHKVKNVFGFIFILHTNFLWLRVRQWGFIFYLSSILTLITRMCVDNCNEISSQNSMSERYCSVIDYLRFLTPLKNTMHENGFVFVHMAHCDDRSGHCVLQ
jgi:hypothetical protein